MLRFHDMRDIKARSSAVECFFPALDTLQVLLETLLQTDKAIAIILL